jgi:hypothetical protein
MEEENTMSGIIRNHLLQMKKEDPKEYNRLMNGYVNEDEFVREALGLSEKAVNHYNSMRIGGTKNV